MNNIHLARPSAVHCSRSVHLFLMLVYCSLVSQFYITPLDNVFPFVFLLYLILLNNKHMLSQVKTANIQVFFLKKLTPVLRQS